MLFRSDINSLLMEYEIHIMELKIILMPEDSSGRFADGLVHTDIQLFGQATKAEPGIISDGIFQQ